MIVAVLPVGNVWFALPGGTVGAVLPVGNVCGSLPGGTVVAGYSLGDSELSSSEDRGSPKYSRSSCLAALESMRGGCCGSNDAEEDVDDTLTLLALGVQVGDGRR